MEHVYVSWVYIEVFSNNKNPNEGEDVLNGEGLIARLCGEETIVRVR